MLSSHSSMATGFNLAGTPGHVHLGIPVAACVALAGCPKAEIRKRSHRADLGRASLSIRHLLGSSLILICLGPKILLREEDHAF
jgi:hypothetical protein